MVLWDVCKVFIRFVRCLQGLIMCMGYLYGFRR